MKIKKPNRAEVSLKFVKELELEERKKKNGGWVL